jgi:NTE family protein
MPFDLNNLEYLALEGGGGRGILYLEPIRVLEERLQSRISQSISSFRGRPLTNLESTSGLLKSPSLFQINIPPEYRVLKGVSGSSAGAITAYMLSLGMSSFDIEFEMNRTDVLPQNSTYKKSISVFETFIDEEPNNLFKSVEDETVGTGTYQNSADKISGILRVLKYLPSIGLPVASTLGSFYSYIKNRYSDGSPFGVIQKIFEEPVAGNTDAFMSNLIGERGIFTGLGIRAYFVELMQNYLLLKLEGAGVETPDTKPEEITFKEFFDLTGVDLVLTGTNIIQHGPRLFSVFSTPDFPVIEAVQISMTLPGIFKPVYVDTNVKAGDDKAQKNYKGLYVDGGMLNNIPIRAFDNIIPSNAISFLSDLTYRESKNSFDVAGNPDLATERNDAVLGLRLQESTKKTIKDRDKIYPEDDSVFMDFMDELMSTLMYPAEEGQLVNPLDRASTVEFQATIEVNPEIELKGLLRELPLFSKKRAEVNMNKTFTIGVADFSTPALDEKRGRTMHALLKRKLMLQAGESLADFLDNSN